MRVDKGFPFSHGLVGCFILAGGIILPILGEVLRRIHRIQNGAGLLQGQGVSRKSGGVMGVLYLELPLLLENFLQRDGGLCLFQLFFLLL